MGRKAYSPTDEQRRLVKAMAGYGVPHDDIALVVRCSPPTLRKVYRHELDLGSAEATARVAQCLYQQATQPGNLGATIFWLKARAGWREKQPTAIAEKDEAQPTTVTVIIDRTAEDGQRAFVPPLIEGSRA